MMKDENEKTENRITNKIWIENKKIADKLAYAYYDSLLKEYDSETMKRDSKENFGFNTFADGINAGLDIILPLLDEQDNKKVLEKIEIMIQRRKRLK